MKLDNGFAPITESVKKDVANVPRSAFDMSRVKYMNGLFGALMPFDLLETLPNEEYEIGYDVLATLRNPTVRQMFNGVKIFVHTYWCPKKDLWKGFRNYITGGRSGNVNLEVPKLMPTFNNPDITASSGTTNKLKCVTSLVPFAPSSYMGLPISNSIDGTKTLTSVYHKNKNYWYVGMLCSSGTGSKSKEVSNFLKSDYPRGITALPFVMYNKIYRDYYANNNLLQDNKYWFPDDEEDALILPYSLPTSTNSDFSGYTNTTSGELVNISGTDEAISRVHVPQKYVVGSTNQEDKPILNAMHFRQFRGDYFTSANPFTDLLRGNMDENIAISTSIDFEDVFNDFTEINMASRNTGSKPYDNYNSMLLGANIDSDTIGFERVIIPPLDNDYVEYQNYEYINNSHKWDNDKLAEIRNVWTEAFNKAKVNVTGITLNALRKQMVLEKLLQRNATTNGNYRELIGIQFGYYPKDDNRRPIYVGGAEYTVNFNTVIATNYDSSNNNLGQKNSDGFASGSGYIGKFHSDDHGYLMSIMSIVPDVYYAKQGIDNMWDRTTKDKEYTPLLNNLEPMAILNKEIYMNTTKAIDQDVFGYADRFEDWKSRRNEITGLALCGEEYDRAQYMLREFSDTPTLNPTTLAMTPDNIDMTPFTSKNEPPFDIAIGCNISKVSPMPYKASPADLGIKY